MYGWGNTDGWWREQCFFTHNGKEEEEEHKINKSNTDFSNKTEVEKIGKSSCKLEGQFIMLWFNQAPIFPSQNAEG